MKTSRTRFYTAILKAFGQTPTAADKEGGGGSGAEMHCVHGLQSEKPSIHPRDAQTKGHARPLTANPH